MPTIGGNTGGTGGASVGAISTTRLDVVDPHLVQMMRDVMAGVDTAGRLGGGQGGAGGGGGGAGGAGKPGTYIHIPV